MKNMPVVMNSQRVIGSAHNCKQYLVEALDFAARGKVKVMIEVFPKERAAEAYERTASGKAGFRTIDTY